MSAEIVSAAVEASFGDRLRATIAPATSKAEASSTISWPTPNRGGSTMLPTAPPMALARPPPSTAVVNHGSQTLNARIAAHSATNHPGCRRVMM